jgi:hypothetical protein
MGTGGVPNTGGDDGNAGSSSSSPFPTLAAVVAILALVVYGVLIFILWRETGAAEPGWSRKVLLLTGVEAITFAAAGWLFGREVNRGAAEAAADAQGAAQGNAREAGQATGRGQGLADAIRASATESVVQGETVGAPAARSQLGSLVDLADRLFPTSRD